MFRLWTAAALACGLLLAAPAAKAESPAQGGTLLVAAKASKPAEDPAVVQAKLDAFVSRYLDGCNVNSASCRTKPIVAPRDGKMVASFIEIDPRSVQVEMYPSPSKQFAYMAKMTYVEHFYESVGSTAEEALNGVFKRVKSRRLTELPRYAQGKWQN